MKEEVEPGASDKLSPAQATVSGLIALDIFSGEPLALAGAGARQKVLPLTPPPRRPLFPFAAGLLWAWPLPGGRVNLTSLSVRALAGVDCSGCSGGGLRYLGTARSDSAHRSCACSSTWGLLDAHSSGHATAVAG